MFQLQYAFLNAAGETIAEFRGSVLQPEPFKLEGDDACADALAGLFKLAAIAGTASEDQRQLADRQERDYLRRLSVVQNRARVRDKAGKLPSYSHVPMIQMPDGVYVMTGFERVETVVLNGEVCVGVQEIADYIARGQAKLGSSDRARLAPDEAIADMFKTYPALMGAMSLQAA